jgi:cytochrome c553
MRPLFMRCIRFIPCIPIGLGWMCLMSMGLGVSFAAEPAAMTSAPAMTRGQQLFTQTCVACHGVDGNATLPAYPKLAGQHAPYLVKQLTEFKSGKRANAIMAGFAGALSEADMTQIAAWVAQQKPSLGVAKNKATIAWGEKIYRGGIAAKGVPACAGCHSPNGAGIPSQYPRLAGQNIDYTVAQLKAFREGLRANGPSMLTIAARLSDKEIAAVADYIAGLR